MTSNKMLGANSIKEAFDLEPILNKIIVGYDHYFSIRSNIIHTLTNH